MFNPLRFTPSLLLALLALGASPALLRAGDAPDEGDDHGVIVTTEKEGSGPARTRVIRMSGRPKLGVLVSPEARPGADEGAEVVAVTPGSPAAEAGLQAGDIILKANGKKLADYAKPAGDGDDTNPAWRGLMEFSVSLNSGDRATLDYRRGGEARSANLTARDLPPARVRVVKTVGPDGKTQQEVVLNDDDELPADTREISLVRGAGPHGLPGGFMDLELTALNPDLGDYFGTRSGVLVTRVPEGSALPLKSGDVLTKIGDERDLKGPGQAMRALRAHESGEKVAVELIRHGKPMTVSLVIPERKVIIRREVQPAPKPDAK
jgi:S1-C subfamily serine protease